ncbi:MAG: Ca-activated chloride channel family protein [Paracoccaceae bacterium]|jgi:Ca-activated chloride channel family protein
MKNLILPSVAVALLLAAACSSHQFTVGRDVSREYGPGAGAPMGIVARESARPSAEVSDLRRSASGVQFDEIIVIEREAGLAALEIKNPGSGELITIIDDVEVRLPLEHTDVAIEVLGPVATGTVKQTFGNPYQVPIEAHYVFPLPHDAAVHDFILTIGDRTIRGVVREREEARRIYEAARAQGYTAALLTQERPNIFTQNVANITPGSKIEVALSYLEPVDHVDGWQEIAFPMVVGPRFNPVGYENGIGAKGYAAGSGTRQPTEVTYLGDRERAKRSGHDVSLRVRLDAGLGVESIVSPSHRVNINATATGAEIVLAKEDSLPNADFRLRWKIAGDGLRTGLVAQGGHALLTLYPPVDLLSLPKRPMEHVFVVDTSGSMGGEPMEIVRAAMLTALSRMDASDSFHIMEFSNAVGTLDPDPLPATPQNIARAERYIKELRAGGGTNMLPAMQSALARPYDGERPRVITFFTDGYIGNENEILAAIQTRTADARIFSFGIGSSPNRWLMAEMAKQSDGAEAYIGLGENPKAAIEAYFDRVSHPAVDSLEVRFEGAVADCAVEIPKTLFAGRPLTLPFALSGGSTDAVVIVNGRVNGAVRELARISTSAATQSEAPILGKVWARARLAKLAADMRVLPPEEGTALAAGMTRLALEHGLVSALTSFVCVDSSASVTDGGDPTRVDVAVPLPAGMNAMEGSAGSE